MSNTITAFFKGRVGVAEAVYQNDYGIVMNLDGLDLPAHFDCYFSTLGEDEAIPGVGADNQVAIPNDCLTRAGNVTLHIPLHTGANDSEVEYIVYFKVIGRARPVDDGTPEQMTAIEQALALLQNPIGNIEQIVNEALSFTGETFAEMQEQLDADQATFETQMETRADTFETGINSRQTQLESDFDSLNAQYQVAVAAHTVDSEVQNVRVGADGKIYTSAGEAVRTQFTILGDTVDVLDSRFIEGINLFNPNDPDLVENVELVNDGTTNAKANFFASGFIPVEAGKTVCCHYPVGTYGGASSFVWYNANKERIGYSNVPSSNRLVDASGRNYIRYTFTETPESTYFRLTGYMPSESYYMYVYADEMPSEYEAYTTDVELSDSVKLGPNNLGTDSVNKDNTDFVKVNPVNLNDLTALVDGAVSANTGNVDTSATAWSTTGFIPVDGSETYSIYDFGRAYWGNNWCGVPYYDANHNYLGYQTPDTAYTDITAQLRTYTFPATAKYIRLIFRKNRLTPPYLWQTVVLKGTTFPNAYIPYDGEYRLQDIGLSSEFAQPLNHLFGRLAIWNGDSICAADNDAQGGWPLRIGSANKMWARNFGVSGGCIAENVGSAHSVSGTLDTMISTFPNADYILIEGGTNDADLLGTNGIGPFDANDFSDTYINALDRSTFSGALESIFYRLVTQMKGKHIGYIIPQKMGYTEALVTRRRTYFDRAIQICKKWGIPYIDLWNDCYFNWRLSAHWDQSMTGAENEAAGNLYLDGQHLTTTGYAVESPLIAEWMKGI